MSHLQTEKEDWENRFQRRKQLWERANRYLFLSLYKNILSKLPGFQAISTLLYTPFSIAERGLERKRIERVPVDELGRVDTNQKPRYVLNRIVRAFNKQNEDLHKVRC